MLIFDRNCPNVQAASFAVYSLELSLQYLANVKCRDNIVSKIPQQQLLWIVTLAFKIGEFGRETKMRGTMRSTQHRNLFTVRKVGKYYKIPW